MKAEQGDGRTPERWHRKERRRRARIAAQTVGTVDMGAVAARSEGRCYLCDGALDFDIEWPDLGSVSTDHVIPIAEGGEHSTENVRLAHLGCNLRKGVGAA